VGPSGPTSHWPSSPKYAPSTTGQLLLTSLCVSTLLESRPVKGPTTLVAPLAAMSANGEITTTSKAPPRTMLLDGKVYWMPPAMDQPEISTSTAIWFLSSTHSSAGSLVAG